MTFPREDMWQSPFVICLSAKNKSLKLTTEFIENLDSE